MLRWIKARFAAFLSSVVAVQRAELTGQRRRIEHFERRVAGLMERADEAKADSDQRLREAEAAAQDLRAEIATLQRALETEQRAHELTKHEARCIGEENRLLAKIHETDIARRSAERALQVRREAEAEVATDALRGEERE